MIVSKLFRVIILANLAVTVVASTGCTGFFEPRYPIPTTVPPAAPTADPPRELDKIALPPYIIEPPDILLISALKVVPKPPYQLDIFDVVLIRVLGVFEDQPIAEAYSVQPDGTVDLGPTYGRVNVVGLTVQEAEDAIEQHLRQFVQAPEVSVSLAASAGAQQITGQHLVGMDGTVNLGSYGSVFVAGLTIPEARQAIERQLSLRLQEPEVIVDILAYNSKVYYVITEGAGFGDNIAKLPVTGNETVLDAVSNIGGLSRVSSKRIWISRPAPNGVGCAQILPVDWEAITRDAVTSTNYQLLPGDRLFIAEDPMARFDSVVARVTQPFERLLGFTSLGTATFNRIKRFGLGISN
jgi:polysaccharide export outer membrane protein